MSKVTTIAFSDVPTTRLDMSWITTAITKACSADQAKKLTIQMGNKNIEVGELFKIKGDFNNQNITLENSSTRLDYIGHALPKGVQLVVHGDCGVYCGAQLAGGKLVIEGSTSDFTACAMHSGLVEVRQNCGHYTGAAYAGHKKGMSGGTILVHGDTGDFAGDLMRRGVIMVAGNIGDYCGSRMIAGTITNLGTVGRHAGAGMRRGTLLFAELPENMGEAFSNCGRHNLGYLTLLLHELRTYHSQFRSLHSMRRRVQKYMGDLSVGGLGEVLIWIG